MRYHKSRFTTKDHFEAIGGNGRVGDVLQKIRLILDIFLNLEQVILVGMPLYIERQACGSPDLVKGQHQRIRVHDQRFQPGFLVNVGNVAGPAALRIPADFGTLAHILLPDIQRMLQRVDADFLRDVGQHEMDIGAGYRFNLTLCYQSFQFCQYFRCLLRHLLNGDSAGLKSNLIIVARNQIE